MTTPVQLKNYLRKKLHQNQAIGHLKLTFQQYMGYVAALTINPKSRKAKFVIFGQGRTGSTLLRLLLDQHPEITCEGQFFIKPCRNPLLMINGRSRLNNANTYGFKLHTYQPSNILGYSSTAEFLNLLHEEGFRFLHLKRLNTFRHALSIITARKWGYSFKSRDEVNALPKLTIEKTELYREIESRRRFNELEANALTGLNSKEVVYERALIDEGSRQSSLPAIFHFLNVNSEFKPEAPLARATHNDISRFIDNYEEIIKVGDAIKD